MLPHNHLTNRASYGFVDQLTYAGNQAIIKKFRQRLKLKEINASGIQHRAAVPHVYCFSEHLVPRPSDWGHHIDICGFLTLEQTKEGKDNYEPPEGLQAFLDAGEPPVYIGFGSIVIDDVEPFTRRIFKAIEQSGVRAIVSSGWSNIAEAIEVPSNVYLIGPCPHDWLFPRCSAVWYVSQY